MSGVIENNETDYRMNLDAIIVANSLSPLVVLFGPAASGKTMVLIRLSQFLLNKGYRIVPDRAFRRDDYYDEVCDSFEKLLFSNYAAGCTSGAKMMLVKVIDRKGEVVCQILDAPGPFFFDPNVPNEFWRKSIDYIRNLQNKRVWLYFVEEGWRDGETRARYAKRIKQHVFDSSSADKSVFVFSKVDNTNYLKNSKEEVNMPILCKTINNQYPNIFAPFAKKIPLKWLKIYNCRFVPFSSGIYYPIIDKSGVPREEFIMGPDVFPKLLWDAILRSIK